MFFWRLSPSNSTLANLPLVILRMGDEILSRTWRLCGRITGDESSFHHKQIRQKISNKAWVDIGDLSPTVVRGNRFAPNNLFSIFFKSTGPILIHRVERVQTIDHHFYINQCLRSLIDEIKRQKLSYGTRRMKIYYDNGRPHLHKNVPNYLESEGLRIIRHPPILQIYHFMTSSYST